MKNNRITSDISFNLLVQNYRSFEKSQTIILEFGCIFSNGVNEYYKQNLRLVIVEIMIGKSMRSFE